MPSPRTPHTEPPLPSTTNDLNPSPPQLSPNPIANSIPLPHQTPHFDFPALTPSNLVQWCLSVESHAAVNNILEYIIGPVPPDPTDPPQRQAHQRNLALARILIIPNISQEVLTGISPTLLSSHPSYIYQHLKDKLSIVPPQNSEASLRNAANQIHYSSDSGIHDYITKHKELRNIMLQSGFPNIDDEATTIKFVIDGLQIHQDWAPLLRELANFPNFHNGQRPSLDLVFTMLITHEQAVPHTHSTTNILPNTSQIPATMVPPSYQHANTFSHTTLQPPYHHPQPPYYQMQYPPARQRTYRGRGNRRNARFPVTNIHDYHSPPPGHNGPWCTLHGTMTHDTQNFWTRQHLMRHHKA